jgi:type IV secretion system protein VirB6
MATSVFSGFEATLHQPAINFMTTTSANLAGTLAAPLRSTLLLMVMWHGIQILRGEEQEPIWSLIRKLMKGSVIVMLVTNSGDYQTYVSDVLFKTLPDELSGALGFKPATAGRFDAMLTGAAQYSENLYKEAGWGWGIIKAAVVAFLVYFVMGLLAAQGYFTFLYAEFALALIVGIGPAFICCALFNQTRKYFEGWLGLCINFVILKILSLAVLSFMLTTFDTLYNAKSGGDIAAASLGIITAAFFCMGILHHLPSLAASMASGHAFSGNTGPVSSARAAHTGSVGNIENFKSARAGIGERVGRARKEGIGQFFQPVSRTSGRAGAGPGNKPGQSESETVAQQAKRD